MPAFSSTVPICGRESQAGFCGGEKGVFGGEGGCMCAYHITRSIIDSSQRASRIVVC